MHGTLPAYDYRAVCLAEVIVLLFSTAGCASPGVCRLPTLRRTSDACRHVTQYPRGVFLTRPKTSRAGCIGSRHCAITAAARRTLTTRLGRQLVAVRWPLDVRDRRGHVAAAAAPALEVHRAAVRALVDGDQVEGVGHGVTLRRPRAS